MNKLPKVLVAVVTYEGKDYVWEEFIKTIRNFSYPNFDLLIVDNSRTKAYFNKLRKRLNRHNERVVHVNRGINSREAQAKSLNKAREIFLKEGYDYFFSLESDTIPTTDIIERLISHRKPVVGAMYLIGHDWSETQPSRPCLFTVVNKGKESATKNIPAKDGWKFFGHGVVKIHGCGIGCTMIQRHILEKFRFWWYAEEDDVAKHSDVLFYMDLHNNGYEVFVDTDIYVQHFRSNWDDVKDI